MQIPILLPPTTEIIATDPAKFVNYYRVRIDPRKAENTDQVLAFQFSDKTVGLHVRNGIAEYVSDFANYYRQPDMIIALDGKTFASLYLNTTDLAAAVNDGSVKVIKGDQKVVTAVLDLFDKFKPAMNVTIPSDGAN